MKKKKKNNKTSGISHHQVILKYTPTGGLLAPFIIPSRSTWVGARLMLDRVTRKITHTLAGRISKADILDNGENTPRQASQVRDVRFRKGPDEILFPKTTIFGCV